MRDALPDAWRRHPARSDRVKRDRELGPSAQNVYRLFIIDRDIGPTYGRRVGVVVRAVGAVLEEVRRVPVVTPCAYRLTIEVHADHAGICVMHDA